MTDSVAVNDGGVVDFSPAPVVFHSREVPKEWETRLREISPISDVVSWLALNWFAPAERWVVYEMVPDQFIETGFRSELEGEHPDRLESWARICSPFQWEMYRKYRVHARPCWVIQGANGGNKVAFSEADQELCRAVGLPIEPPIPGALPYAPFDERVVRQLVKMNKLAKAKNDLQEFRRKHDTTDAYKRTFNENLRAARAQYVAYLNAQFEDGDEEIAKATREGELDAAPRTTDDFTEKAEMQDIRYIETGRF